MQPVHRVKPATKDTLVRKGYPGTLDLKALQVYKAQPAPRDQLDPLVSKGPLVQPGCKVPRAQPVRKVLKETWEAQLDQKVQPERQDLLDQQALLVR